MEMEMEILKVWMVYAKKEPVKLQETMKLVEILELMFQALLSNR